MILTNQDLQSQNTLNLPCTATAVMSITSEQDLKTAQAYAEQHKLPILVLGGGSNVLLPEKLEALVLRPTAKGIDIEELEDSYCVEAQAGENWHQFVDRLVVQGINGLENLALIPGLVGASVIQNIGAYGVEVSQLVDTVNVFDFESAEVIRFSNADCDFAYRDSHFKRNPNRYFVLSITFKLSKCWEAKTQYPALQAELPSSDKPMSARAIFNAVVNVRQSKLPDPAAIPNAGSFFKNPVVSEEKYQELASKYPDIPAYQQPGGSVKLAAGWLIDQCGWKGKSLGPVGMYEKQALVLVSLGDATSDDVNKLKQAIVQTVSDAFGVALDVEPIAL